MKTLFALACALMLAACTTLSPTTNPAGLTPQQAFLQACTGYSAALSVTTQAILAGKLNAAQMQAVKATDATIYPICSGPVPADPQAQITQITAAITTLTIQATEVKK